MFCVKFMTCCDLEKYLGHHVLTALCVQWFYFQFILVGGLLIGSDTCIMAKISGSRLSVMDLLWPWKFSQKSKSYRFDEHLYCIILVFLLIWLQSSHWISRHSTYNQYFVCLEFAVSIILWPYEMRSRSHNKLFFLLKYINGNSVTIHRLVLGIWHRQSPFCLNFEVLVPVWPWKIGQCHTI